MLTIKAMHRTHLMINHGAHARRYSKRLIEPLMHGTPGFRHPAWIAWTVHVAYFIALCADSFDVAGIHYVDSLISTHQELLKNVPGYHRVPKHHLIKHVPKSIFDFGPPVRGVGVQSRVYGARPRYRSLAVLCFLLCAAVLVGLRV